MIRKDMRKEKNPVRRSKDYEIESYKTAVAEYESEHTVSFSEKGLENEMVDDLWGTSSGLNEKADTAGSLPSISVQQRNPKEMTKDNGSMQVVSQPLVSNEEPSVSQGEQLPNVENTSPKASSHEEESLNNSKITVPHYSKSDKGIHAKISLVNENPQQKLKEIQEALYGLNLPEISDLVCDKLRLIKHNGKIYHYAGSCYQLLTEDRFKKVATDYIPIKLQKKLAHMQIFDQAYEYLRVRMLDEPDEESADNWISFENGDFNATTGEFELHSPKHLTFFTIHARFDPSGSSCCPHMDQMLEFMTGNDKVSIELIWSMLAYLMLDTPPHRVFFYLGPAPASGKSLLGNIIDQLFGPGGCYHAEADALSQRFGLSGFHDSNICLAMEVPGKLKQATVIQIKELTGNATISIERKGIDREEIKNHTRLVIASNYALQVEDDAFWDRCKIIPAVQSCPEDQRDPKLDEKIWAERDAIATRAAYAAHNLILRKFRFVESEYALTLKKSWRKESRNSMDNFIANCLEFTSGQDFISTDQMYSLYSSSGYEEMSRTSFAMKLSAKLSGRAIKKKVQNVNGYVGLQLKGLDNESYH